MAERQPLEVQRPEAACEVLLCTRDGRLLEGLVTNLFVITDGDSRPLPPAADPAAASGGYCSGSGGGSDSTSGAPVVWTAGTSDGVVWGTARARVLDACRRLGFMVREEAPSMHSRHAWQEAFLTNSLRLVQPLHTLSCGAANVWGHAPWELSLPHAQGPVTASLQRALLEALPVLDASELLSPCAALALPQTAE